MVSVTGSLTALIAVVAAASCAGGSYRPPVSRAEVEEIRRFRTVREMVAASDFVTRARVVDVRPGRRIGLEESEEEEDARLRMREVTLQIEEVLDADERLAYAVAGADRTLLLEELGWEGATTVVVNGLWPSEVGDVGIYFLVRIQGAEPRSFRLVSSQGRYLIRDGRLLGADQEDALIRSVESLTVAELEEAIGRAGAAFADESR